ncbi:MAG TPA: fused MFS/spermidine synthase [Candidatus Acidoferrales bacterium]|nr:fused MFS/spermidine synthase [Candidatus Acidoferrales bacterium]
MTETKQHPEDSSGTRMGTSGTTRFLPLVLLLFAGSGCSALIYEIVWYQSLQLAIGSTAISLGIVLAVFMGGLCLGSLLIPRMRAAEKHPLRVYAALELGIGIFGLLVLILVPLVDRVYVLGAGYGLMGMLMRGLMAAVCLLPPTMLMGATLPVITRWVKATPNGVAWWGLLYGGNIVGAVFGCLLAGFYLLRLYNMATATFVAASINLGVAAISLGLAVVAPAQATTSEKNEDPRAGSESDTSLRRADDLTIYITIAISGACALGAEVIWTRLMGMMLGATVYVFSIILAVFLIGLAVGSGIGSWLQRVMSPRLALGWCQILLTGGIAWAAYMIADSLPYWPINPLLTISPWYTFQLDLVRCLWAILPAAVLWGASFPLALAAVKSQGEDSGRVVGKIYAANTFGAIVGALGVSLVLVPWIGTQQSQRVLLVFAAIGALCALVPLAVERHSWGIAEGLLAAMVIAGILTWSVDAVPGELIAYGRRMAISAGSSHILYTREGRNSSVAISQWNDGAIEVDVNGHVEATTEPYDMKLQRMVGHLPALLHPHPQSVLGIGFGAGVSAGTFTRYPTIKRIVVCEIEPVIPPTSTMYFAKQDYDVMHNPRTQIIYDDARHYVLTTHETYDIIASDPLDVFVKGTAALYSKEYFESVEKHLNPGGMFTLYVPLYESDEKTVKSEIATFMEAFPYGTVWANTVNGLGYDLVLMGQADPLKINLDEVQQRLSSPDYAAVAESLREIGIGSAVDLFAAYAGDKNDLAPWLEGAELNRDGDMRLQYLAGWGINSRLEDFIYRKIIGYRRAPWNVFTGSPEEMKMLIFAMSAASGTAPPQQ